MVNSPLMPHSSQANQVQGARRYRQARDQHVSVQATTHDVDAGFRDEELLRLWRGGWDALGMPWFPQKYQHPDCTCSFLAMGHGGVQKNIMKIYYFIDDMTARSFEGHGKHKDLDISLLMKKSSHMLLTVYHLMNIGNIVPLQVETTNMSCKISGICN